MLRCTTDRAVFTRLQQGAQGLGVFALGEGSTVSGALDLIQYLVAGSQCRCCFFRLLPVLFNGMLCHLQPLVCCCELLLMGGCLPQQFACGDHPALL